MLPVTIGFYQRDRKGRVTGYLVRVEQAAA